ncbi:MAG: hypothetical protein K2Y22_01610 [Candidatus Obscuribacterales bacterium]|nr:hypothetical protein [Candidatus Obscuribacterales bacterium]
MAILVFVAATVDINWAKPHISQMLAEVLHRKVQLGKLKWQFGFSGLAISTDKMSIVEKDNLPLLTTKQSEIGIAFTPLLQGKLEFRYLKFKEPELWAIYLGKGRWNFTDLLEAVIDLHLAEIKKGRIHFRDFSQPLVLVDRQDDNLFGPMDLENVELTFVLPRKGKRWPLNLSYELPREGYRTKVKLTGVGNGAMRDWETSHYRFEFNVEDLKPRDLGPIIRLKPMDDALVDLNIKLDGSLAKLVKLDTKFSIWGIKAGNGPKAERLPATSGSGTLLVDTKKASWNNLAINVGDLTFNSKGELDNWRGHSAVFGGDAEGSLGPIARLFARHVLALKKGNVGLNKTYTVDLNADGAGQKPAAKIEFTVKLNPKSKQIQEMLADTPLAGFLSKNTQTSLTGQIVTTGASRIEIPKAHLTINNADVTVGGFFDQAKHQSSVKFSALQFPLAGLMQSLKNEHHLKTKLPDLKLSGFVDVQGQIDSQNKTNKTVGTIVFKNVGVSYGDGQPLLSKLYGQVTFDNHFLSFNNLHGEIAGGPLTMDGKLPIGSAHGSTNVNIKASHTDLAKVMQALAIINVPLPKELADLKPTGSIKEVRASLSGSLEKPTLSFYAIPDKIKLTAGPSTVMQIVDGKVELKGNALALQNVKVTTGDNHFDLSLTIDDWQDPSSLQAIKVSSPNLRLEELHSILTSLPDTSFAERAYRQLLDQYHISELKGNLSGHLEWIEQENNLNGEASLTEVACKIYNEAIEDFSGKLVVSSDKIILEKASALIGNSRCTISGQLIDHQTATPHWNASLKANAYPQDFLPMMSNWDGPSRPNQISITSEEPIGLVIEAHGNQASCQVHIASHVRPDGDFKIKSKHLTWVKPRHEAIHITSNIAMAKVGEEGAATAELKDFEIQLGQSKMHGSGKFHGLEFETTIETDQDFNAHDVTKTISLNDKSMSKLERAIKGTRGQLRGMVTLTGSLDNLRISGHLNFKDMDLPLMSLADATGSVKSSGWQLFAYDPDTLTPEEKASTASLAVEKAKIGRVDTFDVEAEIAQAGTPGSHNNETWLLVIPALRAKLSNGQLNLRGSFEPFTGKLLMDTKLSKIDINKFFYQLTGNKDEITGIASGHIILESVFGNNKEFLKHTNGSGEITIENGKVTRFGNLQAKITQANLLAQGLLGFNLNNLLQSVVPVRTGEFKKFFAIFDVKNGVIDFDELRYTGDDMRLWGDGEIDLPNEQIKLSIAGNVPRVFSSVIGGKLGQVSRIITIQRLLDTVTLHKFDGMPTLPVIGDIASDKPRAFSFHVVAPSNQPQTIAKSIIKSFGWLQSQPKATAHPVPQI